MPAAIFRSGEAAPRVTLALLTTAGIALALMQTLVIPALPFFQREFDASAGAVTWLVTSFLVSSSVLTPIMGKLGDAHGQKRVLVATLARVAGRRRRVEHRVACGVSRTPRRGRRHLPPVVRDHSRRIPA